MKILIVAGGELDNELLKETVREMGEPFVIGADRGALRLIQNNIKMDIAIGDFDSVEELEKEMILSAAESEVLQSEKDDTDTEHAFRFALDKQPEEIVLLGCTGRRMDHSLSCIGMLRQALEKDVKAFVVDNYNRISIRKGTVQIKKEEQYGKFVSILPYGGSAKGVTMKGFKYEIDNVDIDAAYSLTVSNEITEPVATISCDDYYILLETRD